MRSGGDERFEQMSDGTASGIQSGTAEVGQTAAHPQPTLRVKVRLSWLSRWRGVSLLLPFLVYVFNRPALAWGHACMRVYTHEGIPVHV